MKTLIVLIAIVQVCLGQEATDRVVILPIEKAAKEAPLFFSAAAEVDARVSLNEVSTEQRLTFEVLQGRPDTMSLSLSGAGEVLAVSGENLRDWSVRVAEDGVRFLDIRPLLTVENKLTRLALVVKTRWKSDKNPATLLLPGPGAATGFSLALKIVSDPGVELRVLKAEGLAPISSKDSKQFMGNRAAAVELEISSSGSGSRGIEFSELAIIGQKSSDNSYLACRLSGRARAVAAGSAIELLGGGAALSGGVSGEGWHVALREQAGEFVYDLIAERSGELNIVLEMEVPIKQEGDWRQLDFKLPAGVVVPLRLEGLEEGVVFNRELTVVPEREEKQWRGYLPASGAATVAWRAADSVAEGPLFFSSSETTDVRVGSGQLSQSSTVELQVLQGKLLQLSLMLNGNGEVLSVSGDSVVGWSVSQDGAQRRLEVKLSRPIEGSAKFVIEAQATLTGLPLRAAALRFSAVGALRHSGWLRVANQGAVKIEVADARGLIQLAPGQFPGEADETLRQVFVYRFPAADYDYAIEVNQVLPEVSVNEISVYELAEMDQRIVSDLELDIREAPLREWEMEIPEDYAVAAVTGDAVEDYALASEAKDGKRRLKIIFKEPVIERQLIQVQLEKNAVAKAGSWQLPPLDYPGVKSRRGYVGAVAAAGYRLTVGETGAVAELPLTFFPKKVVGLQQAFRLREGAWKIGMAVEALGQSVQADVFHLYSLKSGAAYGSVLINYFVVGAPATGWRIALPEGVGNLDVTGQDIGRDWRREGNVLIVPLSRPVSGTATLLLTFEQPMSARGGELNPGEVRPLDVQAERGYVQVVSPLQVKFESPQSEGPLLAIDSSELPAEFRLLSSAPTLAAWQYTARDFKIGMKIEWFKAGETVEQVVDFLKLASQISRDGQWVTDARFFVKSRGRNALRLALPKGVALWEAKVSGESVNARSDGGETLIPLPLQTDPNQALEVALRYGARSESATFARLTAPQLAVPLVIGEWTATGDEGRQLVPRGGTAELIKPVLAQSGWEWLGSHSGMSLVLLLSGLATRFFGGQKTRGISQVLAVLSGVIFIVTAVMLGAAAVVMGRGNAAVLEYAAPVVAAGSVVSIEVGNVVPWIARTGWWVAVIFTLGGVGAIYGWLLKRRIWLVVGVAATLAALFLIRGGAGFCLGLVAVIVLIWLMPIVLRILSDLRKPKLAEVAAAFILFAGFLVQSASAAEMAILKPAESMVHDWRIRDGRLYGTTEFTLRGEANERFLLLQPPAVLSGFEGNGLRVIKAMYDQAEAYFVVLEKAGKWSGRAIFEMPLADPILGWAMPAGPAAMRKVTLRWDQAGWEFYSPAAARTQVLTELNSDQSGATIVLTPAAVVTFGVRAKQRDLAAEEVKFFAEVSNLYLPGAGVVNGRHRVSIRPTQGRVSALLLSVPEGFTVSDVSDGPIGSWRFDPEKRELRVLLGAAQDQEFEFTVESQRSEGSLPMELILAPLRVSGAVDDVGLLGLAFGDDAQAEAFETEGLSRVNPEDFDQKLLPKDDDDQLLVQLQNVFRYGAGVIKAKLRVTAVAPELRAESWQRISLGEDRLLLATDLTVLISRCGVFRLELEIPTGLEIESVTGENLSHWTDVKTDTKRILTLHLNGKTVGKCDFKLAFSDRSPGAQAKWAVPRLMLQDASREIGVVILVPERGLQIRAVERRNVSQLDPREISAAPADSERAANQPGALAYRLLQSDWALDLAIDRLEPWVAAEVLQEGTLREGQLLTRAVIGYKIENAALKSLRVRIPNLDAVAAATVRASGSAVADLVPVTGEDGLWEIRFQRGIAGETSVILEYQRASKGAGEETIEPILLENVKKLSYFAVVRAAGRLELESGQLPRGWQRTDWAVVQSTLGQVAGNVAPLMAYQVADPEGPLRLVLKRLPLAELQKIRVSEGSLTSLTSPQGDALTAVELKMQITGKGTLRLKLPKNAALFNVLVNDEGAILVREGDEWLFYVFPSADAARPATVRFVYSTKTIDGKCLEGPILNVPMENLTWRVLVPQGWEMKNHRGDFDLKQQQAMGLFQLEDYQSFVQNKKQTDSKTAVALLEQANHWLAAGDQEKASNAFTNLVRSNQLDAASDEDARVQLRQLKTQQAVLGLNTRRQKLTMDNSGVKQVEIASQFNRAAEVNPILRGNSNYDPKEFDRFLEGNTVDENSALKDIANRIVTQQLAAEPAPVALNVTLPERGTVLTFGRSVQVDGARPMAIYLTLQRSAGGNGWLGGLVFLTVGSMVSMWRLQDSEKSN